MGREFYVVQALHIIFFPNMFQNPFTTAVQDFKHLLDGVTGNAEAIYICDLKLHINVN